MAPIAMDGTRISYGPTFSLIAEPGVTNSPPTYLGSLKWNMTPRFDIVGSLTDTITKSQGNILNNLSTFALSPEHVFYESQSNYQQALGQSLFPQLAAVSPVPMLGLVPDKRSIETKAPSSPLSIMTSGPNIRDQLNVTPETIQPKSWLYGVRLDATRELIGYAGISYSVASEFGGQDRIIRLTYKLAKTLDSYLTASYLQRESSGEIVANVPLSDFTMIIGTRRTFGP